VVAEIAYAFQDAALKHVTDRTERAIKWWNEQRSADSAPLSCVVLAGGVAKNRQLRQRLREVLERQAQEATTSSLPLPLYCPEPEFCTDNGTMIAWTGVELLKTPLRAERIVMPNDHERMSRIIERPKWPLSESMPVFPSDYLAYVQRKRRGLNAKFVDSKAAPL
jgi:tRNA A37 threonylcarbamoyltransferase TsaD